MKFVKKNFLSLVIILLVLIVFLQRCGEKPQISDQVRIIRDTVWIVKDSLIYTKPQTIRTVITKNTDSIFTNYVPDTNCAKLLVQYQDVVNQLLSKNIQEDSIRIDTNKYVKITDTVQRNVVIGRSSYVSLSYPVIKEIIKEIPKDQVYLGGGVQGVPGINAISGGVLFKNKKDQIFIGSLGFTTKGDFIYGAQSFWKIKLK